MDIAVEFLRLLVSNSPYVLTAFLFIAVVYLLWERSENTKLVKRQLNFIDTLHHEYNASINDIVQKYYSGNLELVQALNEIKIILATMSRKN